MSGPPRSPQRSRCPGRWSLTAAILLRDDNEEAQDAA